MRIDGADIELAIEDFERSCAWHNSFLREMTPTAAEPRILGVTWVSRVVQRILAESKTDALRCQRAAQAYPQHRSACGISDGKLSCDAHDLVAHLPQTIHAHSQYLASGAGRPRRVR